MLFTEKVIAEVWRKGTVVPGYNPSFVRKDACGAWIVRQQYGKMLPYGWQIDHIFPMSKGGNDDIINLRPLQWQNNKSKGDDYPNYMGKVTSMRNVNVAIKKMWTININKQEELRRLYGK